MEGRALISWLQAFTGLALCFSFMFLGRRLSMFSYA